MKPQQFDQAVARIYQHDPQIDPQAYFFLKDALDVALKQAETENKGGHVSAQQLVHAFRGHALQEYGPMAITLMEEWGLSKTADIGTMVFALIHEKMFGKQDSDNEQDFEDVYNFQQAFVEPFLPKHSDTIA